MKKTNKWLIILLSALICLCVAFATACGKTDEPNDDGGKKPGGDNTNTVISSEWETMPENKNENLKYFGYFHGDGFPFSRDRLPDERKFRPLFRGCGCRKDRAAGIKSFRWIFLQIF